MIIQAGNFGYMLAPFVFLPLTTFGWRVSVFSIFSCSLSLFLIYLVYLKKQWNMLRSNGHILLFTNI